MGSKQMLSVMVLQHGMPWITFTCAGVAGLVITGFIVDFRFFLLALIWLFLFAPLTMVFLYFYFGMQPLTAFNVINHTVEFGDNSFTVKLPQDDSENKQEGEKGVKTYTVDNNEVCNVKSGGDYVIIITKKKGWLWLPFSALGNRDLFSTVMKRFSHDK